jgi:hypothetical protein
MGYIEFSMPREIVLRFRDKGRIKYFVETGTYRGNTSFWAAQHFEKVFTIEIDPEISRETASRADRPSNIEFLVGNSRDILPQVIKQLNGSAVFWLDGHWCNVTELGKDMECPLIEELHTLRTLKDSVILIDDARAFLGPLPPPHDNTQWPRVDEIFLLLKSQYPANLVTIADDVIYCLPPGLVSVYDEDYVRQFRRRYEERPGIIKRVWNKFTH